MGGTMGLNRLPENGGEKDIEQLTDVPLVFIGKRAPTFGSILYWSSTSTKLKE
jgi:hypothetical protein